MTQAPPPSRREIVAERIARTALAIGLCSVEAEEIDAIGMASALRKAVAGAVADTGLEPDCVLMDGNPLHAHPAERSVVHGDAKIACIAAASIVAKVTRDAHMVELDDDYPGYHFAESKGYASSEHIAAIRERGLTQDAPRELLWKLLGDRVAFLDGPAPAARRGARR